MRALDGAKCDNDGTTIPKLYIKPGYFRFSVKDHNVYKCMFSRMCLGSNATTSLSVSEASIGIGDGLVASLGTRVLLLLLPQCRPLNSFFSRLLLDFGGILSNRPSRRLRLRTGAVRTRLRC